MTVARRAHIAKVDCSFAMNDVVREAPFFQNEGITIDTNITNNTNTNNNLYDGCCQPSRSSFHGLFNRDRL